MSWLIVYSTGKVRLVDEETQVFSALDVGADVFAVRLNPANLPTLTPVRLTPGSAVTVDRTVSGELEDN